MTSPLFPNAFVPTPFQAGLMTSQAALVRGDRAMAAAEQPVERMEDGGRWCLVSRHRPVPVGLDADKACEASLFFPLPMGRRRPAWRGWHGPSVSGQPARLKGTSAAVLAGQWHRPSSPHRRDIGTKALTGLRPSGPVQGITGHFHGVPIPLSCTSPHKRPSLGRLRGGWKGSGPGRSFAGR
jgi:hypothetical protein